MDATGATVSGMDSYAGMGEEGQRGKKKKREKSSRSVVVRCHHGAAARGDITITSREEQQKGLDSRQ